MRGQFDRVKAKKTERISKIKTDALTRVMEKIEEEDEARAYVKDKIQEREIEELLHIDNLKKTQQRIKVFNEEILSLKES